MEYIQPGNQTGKGKHKWSAPATLRSLKPSLSEYHCNPKTKDVICQCQASFQPLIHTASQVSSPLTTVQNTIVEKLQSSARPKKKIQRGKRHDAIKGDLKDFKAISASIS
jgi:hypothetical protein